MVDTLQFCLAEETPEEYAYRPQMCLQKACFQVSWNSLFSMNRTLGMLNNKSFSRGRFQVLHLVDYGQNELKGGGTDGKFCYKETYTS